jgi:hypothetical protein
MQPEHKMCFITGPVLDTPLFDSVPTQSIPFRHVIKISQTMLIDLINKIINQPLSEGSTLM